jgi:biopolymer transport protein ExbD
VTLNAQGDGYELDGVPKSAEELTGALAAASRAKDPIEVLIRVPPSVPFEKFQRAVRIVRGAGIGTIRLGASEP